LEELILRTLIITLFIFAFQDSWGHAGEDHSKKEASLRNQQKAIEVDTKSNKDTLRKINKEYVTTVKPIFKRSCFDCHSGQTTFPWYYKIPGVKQLIDSDIKEAKSHLDFSKDFPFISHVTPLKDLDAIGKAIKNGSMPPFQYRIMHGESKLTEEEIKQVEKWIKESQEILK
tara:strand:+ start:4508 stop:5023 length:516 start_codon:yes stop_codon:yes gene_type:complete